MAGNIVKWWRQKVLGGYKQFTVLQECATDSEELMSARSAPPDLVMTSDHETSRQVKQQTEEARKKHRKPTTKPNPERVPREDLTCDVAVKGRKLLKQPIQFSFTLYDFDGHGKITKDDILGIVSTIYESIGKSFVVPHHGGSKTINVRMTVSPERKPPKKATFVTAHQQQRIRLRNTKATLNKNTNVKPTMPTPMPIPTINSPKTNRLSPNDSHSKNTQSSAKPAIDEHIYESISNLKCSSTVLIEPKVTGAAQLTPIKSKGDVSATVSNNDTPPSRCSPNYCSPVETGKPKELSPVIGSCGNCSPNEAPFLRKRYARKSRSRRHQKPQDDLTPVARVRSLSVGSENCWTRANNSDEFDCWRNSIRRHELIAIIRDSMEKNRLCFQGNRKLHVPSTRHRQRSQTMTPKVLGDDRYNDTLLHIHEIGSNPCGYDSFLHATICSSGGRVASASSPHVHPQVAKPVQRHSARKSHNTAGGGLAFGYARLPSSSGVPSEPATLPLVDNDSTTTLRITEKEDMPVKERGRRTGGNRSKPCPNLIMEYASIPVGADPIECENLLRPSDEDDCGMTSCGGDGQTKCGDNEHPVCDNNVYRYVHEHIHHHYHHFENAIEA